MLKKYKYTRIYTCTQEETVQNYPKKSCNNNYRPYIIQNNTTTRITSRYALY